MEKKLEIRFDVPAGLDYFLRKINLSLLFGSESQLLTNLMSENSPGQ